MQYLDTFSSWAGICGFLLSVGLAFSSITTTNFKRQLSVYLMLMGSTRSIEKFYNWFNKTLYLIIGEKQFSKNTFLIVMLNALILGILTFWTDNTEKVIMSPDGTFQNMQFVRVFRENIRYTQTLIAFFMCVYLGFFQVFQSRLIVRRFRKKNKTLKIVSLIIVNLLFSCLTTIFSMTTAFIASLLLLWWLYPRQLESLLSDTIVWYIKECRADPDFTLFSWDLYINSSSASFLIALTLLTNMFFLIWIIIELSIFMSGLILKVLHKFNKVTAIVNIQKYPLHFVVIIGIMILFAIGLVIIAFCF